MKNTSTDQRDLKSSPVRMGGPVEAPLISKKAMRSPLFRRLTTIVVIVNVVVLGAGSAVAAISLGRSPSGAVSQSQDPAAVQSSTVVASSDSTPKAPVSVTVPGITISQSSILYAGGEDGFAPGTSATVSFSANNPANTTQSLGTISLLSWTSNLPGCSSSDDPGWITMPSDLVNQDVASGSQAVTKGATITFNNEPVPQNACAGAALSFSYSYGGTGTGVVGNPASLVLHQASLTYSSSGALAPGTSATVTFSVNNPGSGNELIGTISMLSWSSNLPGCSSAATPGLITMSELAVNQDLAAGSGHLIPGSATITFNGEPVAQSACAGAALSFHYVSN